MSLGGEKVGRSRGLFGWLDGDWKFEGENGKYIFSEKGEMLKPETPMVL